MKKMKLGIAALILTAQIFSVTTVRAADSETTDAVATANAKVEVALAQANEKYQEVTTLKEEIATTNDKISQANQDIATKKEELEARLSNMGKRLKGMQESNQSDDIFGVLLSSDSLTDFIGKAYSVTVLQNASQDSLKKLEVTYTDLENTKNELVQTKATLAEKESTLDTENAELQDKISTLKTDLEAIKAKAAAEAEAAKKAAAEKAAADAAAASAAQAQQATVVATPSAPTTSTGGATATTGTKLTVSSTAYSYKQPGLTSSTATGINLATNPMVIAVDPSVIPLGSMVEVPGYGIAIAGDTGGAIKGNIIDVHFPSIAQCSSWGRRTVTITILG